MHYVKTEIYSWRLTRDLRTRIERAARDRKVEVAQVLDMAVLDWLATNERKITGNEEQKRLHAVAERLIGVVRGKDRNRSVSVSKQMRESLGRQYGR